MAKTKKVRKFSSKASSVEVNNPTIDEINVPSDNLWDYMICLFGEKGIGKTTLVGKAEGAMVYMWEPGRTNLSIRQYPYKKNGKMTPPLTYALQKSLVSKALKDDSISILIFDTIDRLYKAAVNEMCADRGISDPSELQDFGATWREIQDDVEELMLSIKTAGKGVCFVSHSKEKEFETSSHNKYSRVVPSCMNGAFEMMKAICDYAFYYGYLGRKRALTLRGDDLIWSACGVSDHFMDANSKKELKQIIIPNSATRAYSTLLKAFDNELVGVTPDEKENLVATAGKPKKIKKKRV